MKALVIVVLACLLASCAKDQPLLLETPSGFAEGRFRNDSPYEVSKVLSGLCVKAKLKVEVSDEHRVVCSMVMEDWDAWLARFILEGSTEPEQKVEFHISRQGDGVLVLANMWIESATPDGRVHREPLKANHQRNDLQQALWYAGAVFPGGNIPCESASCSQGNFGQPPPK